jgi:hypothetical protein
MQFLALSFSIDGGQAFFTGIVAAEMRKQVTYNVKLTLCGSNGNVRNSHCECPVGKGPHCTCKHIVSVLLVLVDFVVNGDLSVVKSCTEQLQTFKKPGKLYSGAPVAAEKMGPGAKDDDDPRPPRFRNRPSYQDELRNATVNYAAKSGMDVSWRYTFPRADLQQAMRDHDYLEKPYAMT